MDLVGGSISEMDWKDGQDLKFYLQKCCLFQTRIILSVSFYSTKNFHFQFSNYLFNKCVMISMRTYIFSTSRFEGLWLS